MPVVYDQDRANVRVEPTAGRGQAPAQLAAMSRSRSKLANRGGIGTYAFVDEVATTAYSPADIFRLWSASGMKPIANCQRTVDRAPMRL